MAGKKKFVLNVSRKNNMRKITGTLKVSDGAEGCDEYE